MELTVKLLNVIDMIFTQCIHTPDIKFYSLNICKFHMSKISKLAVKINIIIFLNNPQK